MCNNEEEDPLCISDELIESLEKENQTRSRSCSKVEILKSAVIPPESLCFVRARMENGFSGTVIVKPNMCAQPGKEWVIPCCVVQVAAGKFKVPVLNVQNSSLNLRRKDLIVSIENVELDSKLDFVVHEDNPENPVFTCIHPGETDAFKDVRIGENLSAEEVRYYSC